MYLDSYLTIRGRTGLKSVLRILSKDLVISIRDNFKKGFSDIFEGKVT